MTEATEHAHMHVSCTGLGGELQWMGARDRSLPHAAYIWEEDLKRVNIK